MPQVKNPVVLLRAVRAMSDPVRCRYCGCIAESRWLDGPKYQRRSLRGIRHLASGDCEPDEWVTVCPDCGAREPFDDALRCAECLEYPCICTAEGLGG